MELTKPLPGLVGREGYCSDDLMSAARMREWFICPFRLFLHSIGYDLGDIQYLHFTTGIFLGVGKHDHTERTA
jgi:hypothetical protein